MVALVILIAFHRLVVVVAEWASRRSAHAVSP
jgi:hypothetical protein